MNLKINIDFIYCQNRGEPFGMFQRNIVNINSDAFSINIKEVIDNKLNIKTNRSMNLALEAETDYRY